MRHSLRLLAVGALVLAVGGGAGPAGATPVAPADTAGALGPGVRAGILLRSGAGSSTDVESVIGGLRGAGPREVTRGGDGGELTFDFVPGIASQNESRFASFLPSATVRTPVFARSPAASVRFATVEQANAPVPEPSGLVLGALGLIGFAAARRRISRA